jgi:transglutaminase-like putative cysteine protease
MRAWPAVLFLLLVPVAFASQEAEDLFASEVIGVDVTVASDLRLVPKSGELDVDYVQADLFFVPKEDTVQRMLSLRTTPKAEPVGNALRFRWEEPKSTRLRYEAASSIEIRNFFPRVLKKIPFPLRDVPAEVRPYLAASEHIDSTNPSIVNHANKLAQGKDDLFVVVSEFAIWTKNNIEYNLSTLTADVSQKASWVLQNRNGVCDELTSLFIAMLRAVGVPARFVSGVSYTASPLFPDKWGAHGWAEVYFPGVGWVPFDPTFGEFGWVDPGHVKMMTSLDPEEASVRLEWRGKNAGLEFSEPDIKASITKVGKRVAPVVSLSVKPLYSDVGFGSHNLAQATITNLQSYYLATEVRLARVSELEVLEPHDRQVILRPLESKTIFWRVKVAENLNDRFVYTIPLGVYTVMNDSAISAFSAAAKGGVHSKVEVTRAMNELDTSGEEVVAQNLEMHCDADKDKLYPAETATITCTLRNLGTTPLPGVRVCIEQTDCKAFDLGIGQTRQVELSQKFTTPGTATLFVRANAPGVTRSLPVPFVMQDLPAINITEVTAPKHVRHGDDFTLIFVLDPVSHSTPQDVRLTVSTNIGTRVFEMDELPAEQVFEIAMHANELSLGVTDIRISAEYEDERGKRYTTSAVAPVELTDVPFFPKLWLWVRGWFE